MEVTNRTRLVCETALLLVIGGMVWPQAALPASQAAKQVVKTRRLEVVDARGKVRGVLTAEEAGGPLLSLFDDKENPPATLAILDGGKSIGLTLGRKPGSGDGIVLAVAEDGSKAVLLESRKGSAAVGIDGEGAPTVALTDNGGSSRTISSKQAALAARASECPVDGRARPCLVWLKCG